MDCESSSFVVTWFQRSIACFLQLNHINPSFSCSKMKSCCCEAKYVESPAISSPKRAIWWSITQPSVELHFSVFIFLNMTLQKRANFQNYSPTEPFWLSFFLSEGNNFVVTWFQQSIPCFLLPHTSLWYQSIFWMFVNVEPSKTMQSLPAMSGLSWKFILDSLTTSLVLIGGYAVCLFTPIVNSSFPHKGRWLG